MRRSGTAGDAPRIRLARRLSYIRNTALPSSIATHGQAVDLGFGHHPFASRSMRSADTDHFVRFSTPSGVMVMMSSCLIPCLAIGCIPGAA